MCIVVGRRLAGVARAAVARARRHIQPETYSEKGICYMAAKAPVQTKGKGACKARAGGPDPPISCAELVDAPEQLVDLRAQERQLALRWPRLLLLDRCEGCCRRRRGP